MGFADGFYYGQGKIIVNASLLAEGDVVRVRSMTAPTKVWNKTVASGDEFLVFEVPGKDYYKISLVQDISDTPTEVINVFRTVDYGQVILVDVLNKNSLAGIQAILNSHMEQQLLSVGDEVPITVGGEEFIMQVAAINLYNNHEIIFVGKNLCGRTVGTYVSVFSSNTNALNVLNTFYTQMDETDKSFLKRWTKQCRNASGGGIVPYDTYVWTPNYKETCGGDTGAAYSPALAQFPIFTNNTSRIKTYQGSAIPWYSCDTQGGANGHWYLYNINAAGAPVAGYATPSATTEDNIGLLPCFALSADV